MNLRAFHPKNPDIEVSFSEINVLRFTYIPGLAPTLKLEIEGFFGLFPFCSILPFQILDSKGEYDPKEILVNTVQPLLERALFGHGPALVYIQQTSHSWLIINVSYLTEVWEDLGGEEGTSDLYLGFVKGCQSSFREYLFEGIDRASELMKEVLAAREAFEKYFKDLGLEIPK